MDDQQLTRYSRHILLPQIDIDAQEKWLRSHALIIGAGGLGGPAALFLAAAGVGRLTIADPDQVDLTNLQRQIIHGQASIGRRKIDSARERLADINPEVGVTTIDRRLDEPLLGEIVEYVDIVLDCSDNFSTRHAVNAACVTHKKPLVSGAAVRFDGQVAVFDPRSGASPCYHCLFPNQGEDRDMPCAVFGVFAPLVGVVGSLQASEALKVLGGVGDSLTGRLLLIDLLSQQMRCIRVPRDPDCPVCGAAAQV